MLEDVLRKWGGEEVQPMDVYRDIFQLGTGMVQRYKGESRNLQSNPLGYWKNEGEDKGHYRILFDDTFEETLRELQEADFAIINGLTYFGRKNTQAAANRMCALIFDLDGVTDETLNNLLHGAIEGAEYDIYPIPNYIALSGHGIHVYYVFDEPVALYPNLKLQLKDLKYALTWKMWNPHTSELKDIQYQGINQGFRPIGGKTKVEGVRVRAFRINRHPFTLDQLCGYVPEENRIDEKKLFKESKISLEEAKKRYPEWYQKRVVEGQELRGRWTCKRDLYEWWIRQIRSGALHHHRYFCIMVLAIYAVKSGVALEDLEADALELIPFLDAIAPNDPFTEKDVWSALECYDERYVRFPIDDIVKLTGIQIQKNRRNYQKQAYHLEEARMLRDLRLKRAGKKWTDGNGRPSKEAEVKAWRQMHPDGKKADCCRDLGLSKPTVYKYWEL